MSAKSLRQMTSEQRTDFLASALSSGGELPTEVATKFIEIAQNATPLLAGCRVEPMASKTKKLPKILFASRVVRADPGDGSALGSGQRIAPTTSEVTLNAKVIEVEGFLGYTALEDNVEGEMFEETYLRLLAEKVGVDLEEMALMSDTDIVDATLVAHGMAQQDGWLKRISSNVINASNAYLSRELLEQARSSVRLKFRRMNRHAFYVAEKAGDRWRNIVADRATATGDRALESVDLPVCGGSKVIQVGNMPVTTGTPDTAPAIFTDPKNLILGWYRKMTIKVVDEPWNGGVHVYIRMRAAFAVEQENAAAKITALRETY